SFGMSLAVIPVIGLGLNLTPAGLRAAPVFVTIAAFVLIATAAAYRRRLRLPIDERLSFTVELSLRNLKSDGPVNQFLSLALAGSILVAVASLALIATSARPVGRFTEFYILGPGGNTSDYPTTMNVSMPEMIILGLTNHERST